MATHLLFSRALSDHGAPTDADWDDVSPHRPCSVCGAGSSCRRHIDNAFVSCARRQSQWPLTNGAWLHRLTELAAPAAREGTSAGAH
jgi:hypothetical protein